MARVTAPARPVVGLLAAVMVVLPPAIASARIPDRTTGRPGPILQTQRVDASHRDPCAPGGLSSPTGQCIQPVLVGVGHFLVGRAPRHRGTQRVTIRCILSVSWDGTAGTWTVNPRPVVRRVMGPRTQRTGIGPWSDISSSGFGYQTVMYQVTWSTADGRKRLGTRIHMSHRHRCATRYVCSSVGTAAWLSNASQGPMLTP